MNLSHLYAFALAMCASLCTLSAQDLPVSSTKAMETLDREIATSRQKAIRALEADLQRVMKSGNLDMANAINAEIENQRRLMPIAGNAMAQMMERMAGRRVVEGHTWDRWVFNADGTVTGPGFTGGAGTWEFDAPAKKIHIKCPRWSISLDWVSDEVWRQDGGKAWNLVREP